MEVYKEAKTRGKNMFRWAILLVFVGSVSAHCNLRHCEYGTGSCHLQFWHEQAGCEARDETAARESFRFDPHTLGRCSHRPGGVFFMALDLNTFLFFDDLDTQQCTGTPIANVRMAQDTCVQGGDEFQPDHPWVRLSCDGETM